VLNGAALIEGVYQNIALRPLSAVNLLMRRAVRVALGSPRRSPAARRFQGNSQLDRRVRLGLQG
jgi:hypothetical protein